MVEVISLLFFLLTVFFILGFVLTLFTGGNFAPTSQKKVAEMLNLVKIEKRGLLVDLGSGDGRIILFAGRRGAQALGFELNPFLYLWSMLRINNSGLKSRVKVQFKNFWAQDLSGASVVCIYLPICSKRLEEKLRMELGPGSCVVTNSTGFPGWKPDLVTPSGIFLYKVKA